MSAFPYWRGAAALLALAAVRTADTAAAADTATSAYQPLAFLVGHCWRGTFPDGQVTDEHCFSWIYGGKFVRDEHVVHRGAGQPDNFGESIYLWDAASGELQYLYIESAGGFSRGTVSSGPQALVFPPTTFSEHGRTQTYRSRWQRSGDDAYDVLTEFQVNDRWVPAFSVHMTRVHP
jgi:hypothetical protein